MSNTPMTPGRAAYESFRPVLVTQKEWSACSTNYRALWDAVGFAAVKAYLANIGRAGGKRGGKATTPRKVAAARNNGRKNRGS